MALYFTILTVVLLALVAGLLLVLHFQLKEWRATSRQAPLLAEKLAEALLSARNGLHDLKKDLVTLGPDLNRLTDEGSKLRVELQFLLQRAAQVAEQLDKTPQTSFTHTQTDDDDVDNMPMARLAPEVQAMVERVAGANGLAAKPSGSRSDGDPLEELLANLQTVDTDDTPVQKMPRRKRSGPVTQAELDLQQSLKGSS